MIGFHFIKTLYMMQSVETLNYVASDSLEF